jgi:S-adenosylmethionine hydrolase
LQKSRTFSVIVLFTDFGPAGPYTGQMKAVLHAAAPGVPIVDLFADAPAGNPKAASYLLAAYAAWFDSGTVFLCVVDPGVGGARPAVVVEVDGRLFVGPGNGLFEILLRRAGSARVREIAWRPPRLSATFHGRDLFAPVAAMLARGEEVPGEARDLTWARQADWPDDLAEIVYIDHYGNAMTGLRASAIPADARLSIAGRAVVAARTFGDRPSGDALWYVNANGLVEIAVNQGRADRTLGLAIGSPVSLLGAKRATSAGKPPRPKPRKGAAPPAAGGNKRLADQTRKILGKHYANKYRVK